MPAHHILSDKAIGKIGNVVKTKEPTETLIRDALGQSGLSLNTFGICHHLSAILQVVIDSLAKSNDQQRRPAPPPGMPPGPKKLAFFIMSEQVEYMMWARQQGDREMAAAAKEKEKEEAKTRKRKQQEIENTQPHKSAKTKVDDIIVVIYSLHGTHLTDGVH